MTRNAKIVCTHGPASVDRDTVTALAKARMSVTRLNADLGDMPDGAILAVPADFEGEFTGDTSTIDGERGVLYAGPVEDVDRQ